MTERRFERVEVGPTKAQKWLKNFNYADNRPIGWGWVNYLARQMKSGHWRDNGEPLIFDKEGQLLDGQHRLAAVVKSGQTFVFDVRKNISTDAFTTIDQGRCRSGGQVFAMMGEKNSTTLASIARMVHNWETSGFPLAGRRISPDELLQTLKRYGDALRQAAATAIALRKTRIPVTTSMSGFCYFLFSQISKKKADEFFGVLMDGTAPYKNHAAVTLSRRLFSESVAHTRKRLPKRAALGLFFRAWNYHHEGKPVTKLAIKMSDDGQFKIPALRGAGRKQCRRGRSSSNGNGA